MTTKSDLVGPRSQASTLEGPPRALSTVPGRAGVAESANPSWIFSIFGVGDRTGGGGSPTWNKEGFVISHGATSATDRGGTGSSGRVGAARRGHSVRQQRYRRAQGHPERYAIWRRRAARMHTAGSRCFYGPQRHQKSNGRRSTRERNVLRHRFFSCASSHNLERSPRTAPRRLPVESQRNSATGSVRPADASSPPVPTNGR